MANRKMAILIGTAYPGCLGGIGFKHPPMVIVTTKGGLVREDLVRLAGSFGYDSYRDVVTVVPVDDPRVVEAEYGLIEMTTGEILAAEPLEYEPGHEQPGAKYVPGGEFSPLEDVDKMSRLLGVHIQNLRASAERLGTEWDVSWVTPPAASPAALVGKNWPTWRPRPNTWVE